MYKHVLTIQLLGYSIPTAIWGRSAAALPDGPGASGQVFGLRLSQTLSNTLVAARPHRMAMDGPGPGSPHELLGKALNFMVHPKFETVPEDILSCELYIVVICCIGHVTVFLLDSVRFLKDWTCSGLQPGSHSFRADMFQYETDVDYKRVFLKIMGEGITSIYRYLSYLPKR